MHELSIMVEALRMAEEAAQAAQAKRIVAVKLRVGRLSGVVPEAMEFAWDAVRSGTMAENAVLEIESVPAVCWCAHCQSEFESPDFFNECPKCRRGDGELRRGSELEIVNIEVE